MNQHLQSFLHSFKVKPVFWKTFIADLVFVALLLIVFTTFSTYLQNRSFEVMGGRTAEEIQQILASSSPEEMLPFFTELKSFLVFAITSISLLTIAFFLLFSLEQAWVWNSLLHRRITKNSYWRWNLLHLGLLIPIVLYGLIFTLIKVITAYVFGAVLTSSPALYLRHAALLDSILLILNNAVSFMLGLLLLLLIFFMYSTFTEKYKVWISVGEGFSLLKAHWNKIWRILLLMVTVALILTGILIPLKQGLQFYPLISTISNVSISLLFISWMRSYLLITLGHGSH